MDFRSWYELEEAIKFGDIAKSAEYGLHHLVTDKGWPIWFKERQMGYRNGVQMANNPKVTLQDNPYQPTDVNHYKGWIAGFTYIRGEENVA